MKKRSKQIRQLEFFVPTFWNLKKKFSVFSTWKNGVFVFLLNSYFFRDSNLSFLLQSIFAKDSCTKVIQLSFYQRGKIWSPLIIMPTNAMPTREPQDTTRNIRPCWTTVRAKWIRWIPNIREAKDNVCMHRPKWPKKEPLLFRSGSSRSSDRTNPRYRNQNVHLQMPLWSRLAHFRTLLKGDTIMAQP